MREIGRLVLVLGLICSLSASSLAYLRTSLAPRIERQSDFYVRGPALERLFGLPADDLLGQKITIAAQRVEYPVFYLREENRVTGLAVEAAGRGGYGGDIVIMIGLDLNTDRILGVEIVSHSETPGLGAQVEKPAFRKQWTGLDLDQSIALRGSGGQVDAISGATFSSAAMIDGTQQIVELIRDHKTEILAQIAKN
jgi:Na+-translocating ferredoxin:NAD+ oxidoreductase subunit G